MRALRPRRGRRAGRSRARARAIARSLMGALLENPAALKSKGVKAALSDIVVAVAVKCAYFTAICAYISRAR